jgi:endoglucanase
MNILILLALLNTNSVSVSWQSIAEAHYQVMVASSLQQPIVWTTLTNILGDGNRLEVLVPKTSPRRFYQVIVRTNPLAGKTLYTESYTPAQEQAIAWKDSEPDKSSKLLVIAAEPTTIWINSQAEVQKISQTFAKCGTNIPSFSLYNIFERDYAAGYSAGGAQTPQAYTNYIDSCVAALSEKPCIVILEPDALPLLNALPETNQVTRLELLRYAIDRLATLTNVVAYVDAGHSHWESSDVMIARLKNIGVQKIRGFSLNVSNFNWTEKEIAYGTLVSEGLGYQHFTIDTSRNGRGPTVDFAFCNPPDRGLGQNPTLETGNPLIDAFLWIKYPGESDGPCNGGPEHGVFWPDYAIKLVENRPT